MVNIGCIEATKRDGHNRKPLSEYWNVNTTLKRIGGIFEDEKYILRINNNIIVLKIIRILFALQRGHDNIIVSVIDQFWAWYFYTYISNTYQWMMAILLYSDIITEPFNQVYTSFFSQYECLSKYGFYA